MDDVFIFLWIVLPIVIGLCAAALIVVTGQVIKARASAVGKRSFEELADELKAANAKIMEEISTMKESLGSINKMMKELE